MSTRGKRSVGSHLELGSRLHLDFSNFSAHFLVSFQPRVPPCAWVCPRPDDRSVVHIVSFNWGVQVRPGSFLPFGKKGVWWGPTKPAGAGPAGALPPLNVEPDSGKAAFCPPPCLPDLGVWFGDSLRGCWLCTRNPISGFYSRFIFVSSTYCLEV